MKLHYLALTFIFSIAFMAANAQKLKGTVYEGSGSTRIPDVFVHDLTNKQMTLTDKNGNFEISAASGHLVVFSAPTYAPDTVYVTDMANKKIRLNPQGIRLSTVNISGTRKAFDPQAEYPEVYEKSKVYPLSPSSWFSREGRNARRLKKYFKREVQEREIDQAFNARTVTSVIPLKGEDLENFMTLYRPKYDDIKSGDQQSLTVYINDAYKKYQALPPEKRRPQRLQE
ncbi:carboxypeptidase-like regulatory domain-containing protein [Mucilaginibacter sp. UR6-1]|uniref:carboxypeptidase-like regulatory domain-containing protein n=1 Tax=Mucilaginibacter sp. UR6-1 TaxID=1435643 RepID=UPI001E480E6D|nr:carboxypeptidase-like regulatory domain-containing protein [Mucilaginibacter sp. UR6-1]MCC8409528.1 carboxypeptidase-like regulatory domain-containing protein [Mucilaginibacter sp. UR6-1]